ncbi:MAG: hypothetical protein R3F39_13020 [Myxococcota bacterium]
MTRLRIVQVRRFATALLFAALTLGSAACSEGNPCEKLTAQLCSAVDAEMCAELSKAPAGDGQDAACAAVLGDERKLAEYLAVAKSAAEQRKAQPATEAPSAE